MSNIVKHTYKLKRGKETDLKQLNPLLLRGEPLTVFCNDGNIRLKIGNGTDYYNDLPFIDNSNSILKNVEFKDNKVDIIDENESAEKYPTVSAVRDYVNQYKHITPITEDTYVYELEDGIYHIDRNTVATIYFDDVEGNGLQDGLLLVSFVEDYGTYHWIAIGRDYGWNEGIWTGYTQQVETQWIATYSIAEKENNKVTRINDNTINHTYYPSVKLMTEYVEEKNKTKQDTLVSGENIKTLNGQSLLGSGDIVIEGGSDVNIVDFDPDGIGEDTIFKNNDIYNANTILRIIELLDLAISGLESVDCKTTIIDKDSDDLQYPSAKATYEYGQKISQSKQDTLKSGENIKTINGESILGEGDIEIQGVSGDSCGITVVDEFDVEEVYGEKEVPSMQAFINAVSMMAEDFATTEDIEKLNAKDVELSDKLTQHKNTYENKLWELEANVNAIGDTLLDKQSILVSGENIKTINGQSILGSGDLEIESGSDVNIIDFNPEGLGEDTVFNDNDIYNANGILRLITMLDELVDQCELEYRKTNIIDENSDEHQYPSAKATYEYGQKISESKQDKLVDGQNIKTINRQSILGEGDLTIESGVDIVTEVDGTHTFEDTQVYNANVVNVLLNEVRDYIDNKVEGQTETISEISALVGGV